MMEEICQLKIEKTKEKGSQHDPEHAADKEETPAGGVPQNAEQRFITMAEVTALLEQEKARAPKERFYAQRPPYPLRVVSKPYPERYEPWAFAQYDGRKGSAVEHVSKFIDKMLCGFQKSQQSLSEGQVPATKHGFTNRFCSRKHYVFIHGWAQWLQSDHNGTKGYERNCF